MSPFWNTLHHFYQRILRGKSEYRNARQYELVLNSMFCTALLACLLAAGFAALNTEHQSDDTIPNIAMFTAALIVLWWLSRAGRHTLTAFALLVCSSLAMANVMLSRRFGLPTVELAAAVIMMTAGTLFEVRLSRAALAAERDLLEQRVIERTQILEETQLRRTLELQRFAEFGRISAQLLHEVSNPLTVASLHLEQADQRSSAAIRQARRSLQQLEKYVTAARRQIQNESTVCNFNPERELRQLLHILRPVAQKAGVRIRVEVLEPVEMQGDPVRFAQIMANLITNAIESYEHSSLPAKDRLVHVRLQRVNRFLQITVNDAGVGVTPVQLTRLFDPFYTTKQDHGRGLGIGLSIVRKTVRDEFYGTICANHNLECGTTFTMLLRIEPPLQLEAITSRKAQVGSSNPATLLSR